MWKYYNNNPCNRSVGDCTVRAVSLALGTSWDNAYDLLVDAGKKLCNMPSGNDVWGAVLAENGFKYVPLPECPGCLTVRDFARAHPRGVFVLAFGEHVATMINGDVYDTGNVWDDAPIYYFRRT